MSLADSFFVDSGVSYYSDVAFCDLSGLWHLEGMEVSILADGAVLDTMIVTDGQLTLPVYVNKVHVGLAYNSDIQTLPAVLERVAAMGQASQANINKVILRVTRACPLFAGPTFEKLTEYKASTATPNGVAQTPVEGQLEIALLPAWGYDAKVCVRQSKPLPFTLLSISLDVASGG
jgi:hypothetical protein